MSVEFVVELVNVSFAYGAKTVFSKLNLEIKKGEFFSVIGPSGCGKSTLLSLIGQHIEPTTGQVIFCADISTTNQHREVVTIFQDDLLFPHMNIKNNISYGLKIRKYNKNQIEQIVDGFSSMLEISDLYLRMPNEVSGGQRQRAAIARSLATNPKLVLLDEPLSSLDYDLRVKTRRRLKSLQSSQDMTFIYVTHNQEEAFSVSDRIAILGQNGTIHQVGSPEEIYQFPADSFVAKFIGIENIFEITGWEKDGRKLRAKIDDDLFIDVPNHLLPGESLPSYLGIHAKSIKLVEDEENNSENILEGVWEHTEFYGPIYLMTLQINKRVSLFSQVQYLPCKTQKGGTVKIQIPIKEIALF